MIIMMMCRFSDFLIKFVCGFIQIKENHTANKLLMKTKLIKSTNGQNQHKEEKIQSDNKRNKKFLSCTFSHVNVLVEKKTKQFVTTTQKIHTNHLFFPHLLTCCFFSHISLAFILRIEGHCGMNVMRDKTGSRLKYWEKREQTN